MTTQIPTVCTNSRDYSSARVPSLLATTCDESPSITRWPSFVSRMQAIGWRRRLVGLRARLLEEADGEDGRLGDGLLESVEGDGHHGDAAVGDLGGAHARGVGAERIEAEHARQVVVLLRSRGGRHQGAYLPHQ